MIFDFARISKKKKKKKDFCISLKQLFDRDFFTGEEEEEEKNCRAHTKIALSEKSKKVFQNDLQLSALFGNLFPAEKVC
jgi:hypothetical protein